MKYGYTEKVRLHLNLANIGWNPSILATFVMNNDGRIKSCEGERQVIMDESGNTLYNYIYTLTFHLPSDDITLRNYLTNDTWVDIHTKALEVVRPYFYEESETTYSIYSIFRYSSIDEEDTPSELTYTLDYNDSACKYRFDKLENVVYLISVDNGNISIDNGAAFINDLTEAPLSLKTYNMSLQENEELDERYRFTHTLQFSMKGYANYTDFQGKYYVIVKDKNSTYWLVNPMFPCKVTYTYTLDSRSSHTDFTMSTISNHPMLMIQNMNESTPYICDYSIDSFEKLLLNQKDYSIKDENNNVIYTNDGFKEIVFNNGTQVFTETYDGTSVQHSITFNINFNDYKSSWHYNILEFTENKYSAVIRDKDDKFITCGFGFGLKPSYTVYGSGSDDFNRIEIVLQDMHDVGGFATITDSGRITKDGGFTYEFTKEYGGFECIGQNKAVYLLQQEVDAFGNTTGRFKCLEGYEEYFVNMNIIGIFTERVEFITSECDSNHCNIATSMPTNIEFKEPECREYTLTANGLWSITTSDEGLSVTPSKGIGGEYTITVCNTYEMEDEDRVMELHLNSCSDQRIFNVFVGNAHCLTRGAEYNISAEKQTLTIPTVCCVRSVTTSQSVVNIQTSDGYIKIGFSKNMSTTSNRTYTFLVTYCDDTTREITVIQSKTYEQWIAEGFICENGNKYQKFIRYTGTTSSSITTPTMEYRQGELIERNSADCSARITRTVFNGNYYCVDGVKMKCMEEEESYDNGNTWTKTSTTSLGDSVEDTDGFCDQEVSYMWVLSNKYQCESFLTRWVAMDIETDYVCSVEENSEHVYVYTKSYKENKEISKNGGITWEKTDEYRKGDVYEYSSEDCGDDGSVTPQEPIYKWEEVENDYICDECGDRVLYKMVQYAQSCETYEFNADTPVEKAYYRLYASIDGGETYTVVYPYETESYDLEYYSPMCTNRNYRVKYDIGLISTSNFIPYAIQHCDGVVEGYTCSDLDRTETGPNNEWVIPYPTVYDFRIGKEVTRILNLKGLQFKSVRQLYYKDYIEYRPMLVIPNTVTELASECFDGCNLQDVYFEAATPPTFYSEVFKNCGSLENIYVPSDSVDLYKLAENFSIYADKIKAIPNNINVWQI